MAVGILPQVVARVVKTVAELQNSFSKAARGTAESDLAVSANLLPPLPKGIESVVPSISRNTVIEEFPRLVGTDLATRNRQFFPIYVVGKQIGDRNCQHLCQ